MTRRRLTLVAVIVPFAAADLAHKAIAGADYHHERSPLIVLPMALVVLGLVALVPRVPSHAAIVGAGIAAGGALGNLVSVLVWSQGVPDPLVIAGAAHGIAFNLADTFALAGDALLLSAVVLHGLRHRARLHESV